MVVDRRDVRMDRAAGARQRSKGPSTSILLVRGLHVPAGVRIAIRCYVVWRYCQGPDPTRQNVEA